MIKRSCLLLAFAFLAITALAQNDDYNEFRQQMLNDYNGYRRGILDNYAKFLDTVWKDYTAFNPHCRYISCN